VDGQAIDKADPAAIIAVIFGASEFPYADALSPSPAFEGSASAFAAYLQSEQGFRLPAARVLNLFDNESNVIDQNDRLIAHLLENDDASDLIIYYVGHGGFLPDREYFLALRSTKRGAESITGLRIRALAHSLEEHFPGKRVFLILDCCFAGEAVAQFQGGELTSIVENKTFDALPASGTSLLVAASKDDPAIAPMGSDYTMFSDCFLAALKQGLVDGEQKLSLADVGELVQKLVRDKFGLRSVRPEIHSPRQTGGDVAKTPLFPNPAYAPPKPKRLPGEIHDALRNPIADIRQAAIRPLGQFLISSDQALADLARTELERLASTDDSRSVQQRAREALQSWTAAPGQKEPPHAGKRTTERKKPAHADEPAPIESKATPSSPRKLPTFRFLVAIIAFLFVFMLVMQAFLTPSQRDIGKDRTSSSPEAESQPPAVETGARDRAQQLKDLETRAAKPLEEMLSPAKRDPAPGRAANPAPAKAVEPSGEAKTAQSGNPAALKRQIQEREIIRSLLAEAEDDLQHDRLTSPKDNNAVQRYRAVLDRDPGNEAARAGLTRVVSRYVTLADGAMGAGKIAKAETYLAKAEAIAPATPELVTMRARLEKERPAAKREKVQALLTDAQRHYQLAEQGSSTFERAMELYRTALDLDPGNRDASAGIGRVLDTYLYRAEALIDEHKLDQAAAYLAKAREVDSGNAVLASLSAKLERLRTVPAQLSFAVFPFESLSNCHYSVRDEVTDAAKAIVGDQSQAKIGYSYYAEGADASRIPRTGALWSDNAVRREPMIDTVRKAGRNLGVNGVLMVWFKCSQSQYVPVDTYQVEVYLIDVDRDSVYRAKEYFLDTKRAVNTVFDQFFAAYGIGPG
jgi:tetratricopeptide (TPR) repeat protein